MGAPSHACRLAAVVPIQDTLNNLQVLSGNEHLVTVKDSLNSRLQNATFLQTFLNNPNCSIAIDVLSGGDIVVFQG